MPNGQQAAPTMGDYLAGNVTGALQGEMGFSPEYMNMARERYKRQLNRQFFGSPTGETLGEFDRAGRELAQRGLTAGGAPDAKRVALAANMMEQERIFEEDLSLKDMEERLRNRLAWAGYVPTLDEMARANLTTQEQIMLDRLRTQEDIFARLFGLEEEAGRNRLLDLMGASTTGTQQFANQLPQMFQNYLNSILQSFMFGGASGAQRGGMGLTDVLGLFF